MYNNQFFYNTDQVNGCKTKTLCALQSKPTYKKLTYKKLQADIFLIIYQHVRNC